MSTFAKEELREAHRVLLSTLGKCEKLRGTCSLRYSASSR